jgi:hypothetical protein
MTEGSGMKQETVMRNLPNGATIRQMCLVVRDLEGDGPMER